MRRGLLFLFILACLYVVHVPHMYAAMLYIEPADVEVHRADTVSIAVRLDTDEGECVNTIDAVVHYSGDSLQAVDVSRGRSILTLWVEEPTIDKDARTITFAGGIPNGYCGRISGDPSLTNIIAELVFRVPGFSVGKSGELFSEITFGPETRALLNDGLGSEAPLMTMPGIVRILDGVGQNVSDPWSSRIESDIDSPEPFTVELVQNDEVFSGKYYIVFSTTDKQSGMDHFEVIEESREEVSLFRWGAADAPWSEVKSPYILKDQTLNSVIRVKAIDKAGNEYIAVLTPDASLQKTLWMPFVLIGSGILLLILVVATGWYLLRRRRKAQHIEAKSDESPSENI